MTQSTIDYDTLAQAQGGASAGVDYDAIARKYGGVAVQSAVSAEPQPTTPPAAKPAPSLNMATVPGAVPGTPSPAQALRPKVDMQPVETPPSGVAVAQAPPPIKPTGLPKPLVPGNIDLGNRPTIKNSDGTHSSEYSFSFGTDKGEVLIPTIANGKFLTPDGKKPPKGTAAEKAMFEAAKQRYRQTGEHMGIFANPDDADAYAEAIHNRNQGPSMATVPGAVAGTPSPTQTPRPQVNMQPQAAAPIAVPSSVKVTPPISPESQYKGYGSEAEGLQGAEAISGVKGYPEMAAGFKKLVPTATQPTPSAKEAEVGATQILKGAGTAATPLMVVGSVLQPVAAVLALGGATAGGAGAKKLAESLHASPEARDLVEQAGQIAGGFAGGAAFGGLKHLADPENALTDLLWKRGYVQDNDGKPIYITSQEQARSVAQEIIKQNPQGIIGSAKTKMQAQAAAENVPARQSMGVAEPAPPQSALPETAAGKPVIHASNDIEALRASAERQAPKVGDAVAAATEPVPGAKVEAVRDSKDTDRIADKAARQGVQPSQVGDISGAKISVPDQAAAAQVLQNLDKELPVQTAEGSVTGKPQNNAIRQVQAKVDTQAPPSEPVKQAEILLQTPEMERAGEATHDQYRKAQDLRAQGKEAEAAQIEQKIVDEHNAAEQAAQSRLEADNALRQPGPGSVLQHPQEETRAAGSKRGRVEPSQQGQEVAATRPEAAQEKPQLGVDFDDTLFKENPDGSIGQPIPERIASLKQRVAAGENVIVESHRVKDRPEEVGKIQDALESVGLPRLPVTAKKNAAPDLVDDTARKESGVTVQKVIPDANTPLPREPGQAPIPPGTRGGGEVEKPAVSAQPSKVPDLRAPKPVASAAKTPAVEKAVAAPKPVGVAEREVQPVEEKPFKYRSTQVNIPETSEASHALNAARDRIPQADLLGKGKDVGGNHLTVKYGLKANDADKLTALLTYIAALAPFEATLGKTEMFPPTEHSDGAAVIQAPVNASELTKINSEMEKHGDFKPSDFAEFKPHSTVAYVRPEVAGRYVGMSITAGKKFPVNEIAITDRNGKQEVVKLQGKSSEVATQKELVPKKGADGKHYVHLAGAGAPTINARVESAEEASAAVQLYRDKYDLAGSTMGEGFGVIYDPSGKQIGHVSYNGRVWPGTAQEWKPGTKPLQEAYDFKKQSEVATSKVKGSTETPAESALRAIREQTAKEIAALSPDDLIAKHNQIIETAIDRFRRLGLSKSDAEARAQRIASDLQPGLQQSVDNIEKLQGKRPEVATSKPPSKLRTKGTAPEQANVPYTFHGVEKVEGKRQDSAWPNGRETWRARTSGGELDFYAEPGLNESEAQDEAAKIIGQNLRAGVDPERIFNKPVTSKPPSTPAAKDNERTAEKDNVKTTPAVVPVTAEGVKPVSQAKTGTREYLNGGFGPVRKAPAPREIEDLKSRIADLEAKQAPRAPKPPASREGTTYQARGAEIADRLRTVADRMDSQIENARRPMEQNPTPKRMAQYRSRVIDADEMERTQKAMRALADAHEAGTIPQELAALRSKDEIGRLVHKGLDSSKGGYYDRIPRQDYYDKTPAGKKLQEMIEGAKTPEATAAKLAKEKASKISQLEADVQFRPMPGYFPTPKATAERLVRMADIRSGMSVLEPSAGKGNIAEAIRDGAPEAKLSVAEQAPKLQEILKLKDFNLVDSDFLQHDAHYDRIVMNPPFEKNADIEHVRHAYDLLKPGGRLVAIMSPHAEFASDKKSADFREWMDSLGGESEKLPEGSFKESGTGVASRIVTIDKPVAAEKTEEAKAPKPLKGVEAYGAEMVSYGGQQMPRSEVIKDLQAKGLTPKEVDIYLAGQEQGAKLREKAVAPKPPEVKETNKTPGEGHIPVRQEERSATEPSGSVPLSLEDAIVKLEKDRASDPVADLLLKRLDKAFDEKRGGVTEAQQSIRDYVAGKPTREAEVVRSEAYKPPEGGKLAVRPVMSSMWSQEKPSYSLMDMREGTKIGSVTRDWDEIVARADKENLRMGEAERDRLARIEKERVPGTEAYKKLQEQVAEKEAKVNPSEDQQTFRDGVMMENGRVGKNAHDYGRVVSGLVSVLESKGVKATLDHAYYKPSGKPLYWELTDLFHNPLASMNPKMPVETIARAMDGALPTTAPKIDERGWKFKNSFEMGHPSSSMEKDLERGGKFGQELETSENGAEKMRRKADIVQALLGETENVKKARTAADDLEKDADTLRERAEGAIATAKEGEEKTAHELKERPFTLAKQIQPIENATWTPKAAWVRNMVKTGEKTPWISDGHSAINLDLLPRKAANMAGERKFASSKVDKLVEQDPQNPGYVTAENMQKVLDAATKKSTSPGIVIGYLPKEALGEKARLPTAYIENSVSKRVISVNATLLRMVQDIVKPDSIKVGGTEGAVAFYKGDKLAAIVLPLRKDEPDIDVPTAKKTVAAAQPAVSTGPPRAPKPPEKRTPATTPEGTFRHKEAFNEAKKQLGPDAKWGDLLELAAKIQAGKP